MADYIEFTPDELLERLARTLKKEIGPAVGDAYPKTQAFMAAVVLQKLAGQLRLADEHAAASQRDLQALAKRTRSLDGLPRYASCATGRRAYGPPGPRYGECVRPD